MYMAFCKLLFKVIVCDMVNFDLLVVTVTNFCGLFLIKVIPLQELFPE